MNAITNRKSVRKYTDEDVSYELIEKIVDAGRLAPSWVNVQPWKFIVVKNQETKDLLSLASGGQKQVKTAPVVICCVADLDSWNRTKFGKVLEQKGLDETTRDGILSSKLLNPSNLGEYEVLLRSVEQLTYAVSYMTLACQELDLGCCIVGAVSNELTKNDEELTLKIKEKLNLGRNQILVDLLTIGFEENPKTSIKLRKPKEETVFYEML